MIDKTRMLQRMLSFLIFLDKKIKFLKNINTSYSSPSNLISAVRPLLFLLYLNDLSQAVVRQLLLYADGTCIVSQHKNVSEIEKQLPRDFSSLCDWFFDNKLSMHYGQDKTKSFLFGAKHKLRTLFTANAKSL